MWAIVNGKIYSSDDAPMLILFSHEEVMQFRSQPPSVDMHCSGPREWKKARIEQWMSENKGRLIRAMRGGVKNEGPWMKSMVPPPPKKLSDDGLKIMVEALDPDSIEVYDDQYGEEGYEVKADDRK